MLECFSNRVFLAVSALAGYVVIAELLPALAADAHWRSGGWSGRGGGGACRDLILLRFPGDGNFGRVESNALGDEAVGCFSNQAFIVVAFDFRKLRHFFSKDVLGAIPNIFAAGHDSLLKKTWERIFAPYTKWRPLVRVAGGAAWSMDRETTSAIQETPLVRMLEICIDPVNAGLTLVPRLSGTLRARHQETETLTQEVARPRV